MEGWTGIIPMSTTRGAAALLSRTRSWPGPDRYVRAPPLHDRALWREPYTRRLLDKLSEQTRLILFNPRGTGLSDRPRGVTLESRMDDMIAIVEAIGVDRITLFGVSESANVCALFASTYPERCEHLVLFMPYIVATRDPEEGAATVREMREHWGERAWMEEFASFINPEYGRVPELLDWFIWMQRAAASPESAAAFARMQVETDMREVLPAVKVPTLIVHRAHDRDDARAFAEPIHGAEILEVAGIGYDPNSSTDELAGAVVSRARQDILPAVPETVLTTLLFTDLTDSQPPPLGSAIGHGASFSTNIMGTSGASWLDSGG